EVVAVRAVDDCRATLPEHVTEHVVTEAPSRRLARSEQTVRRGTHVAVQRRCRRRIRLDHRKDELDDVGFICGAAHMIGSIRGWQRERLMEDLLRTLPTLRIERLHGSSLSRAASHARAASQSRCTVASETPSAAAVSATSMPAK